MHAKRHPRLPLHRSMYRLAQMLALSGACFSSPSMSQTLVSLPAATPVNNFRPMADSTQSSFEIQLKALDSETSPPVVTALAASHEGRFLAIAGDDHTIRVVDVQSGRELQAFAGHIDWVQSLVFVQEAGSPATAAPLLYSAGDDGRVLEWKYEFPVRSREVIRVPHAVRSISVSADQKLLAIGGFSEEILIWDLASNTLRHRLHCDRSDQRCVRFSPDGLRVLSCGRDGEVVVWETHSGAVLVTKKLHDGRIKTAGFSVDGTQVTSVGEDRRLVRFDVATGDIMWSRELGKAKLQALCLVNDSLVAVAGSDNKIRLYDTIAEGVVAELEGHTGSVAVLVPCGEFLASGSFDTTVRIWDLEAIGRAGGAARPVHHAPFKMDAELRIR